METFGGMIRKLREEGSLSLDALAVSVEISKATLIKIEEGKNHATKEQMVKIAICFKEKETELATIWMSELIRIGDWKRLGTPR